MQRWQRRRFLQVIGATSTAALGACATAGQAVTPPVVPAAEPERTGVAPSEADVTQPPSAAATPPPLTLNATEYAFTEAAVDILIPADELTPSGSECGVAVFVDRQLAGAYGAGARLYRSGPFAPGKPEHGYQLSLTPRELYVASVAAINGWTQRDHGKPFDALDEATRRELLERLERGDAPVPSAQIFFELLLTLTMEGFFSDPMYGGNRDMVAWKMIGYPGLPATYQQDIVSYHGRQYDRPPQSIIDFS